MVAALQLISSFLVAFLLNDMNDEQNHIHMPLDLMKVTVASHRVSAHFSEQIQPPSCTWRLRRYVSYSCYFFPHRQICGLGLDATVEIIMMASTNTRLHSEPVLLISE